MKIFGLLFLASAAGCGSPFYAAIGPADTGATTESGAESAAVEGGLEDATREASRHHDARSMVDVSSENMPPQDASEAAPATDTGPTDTGCTPPINATSACGGIPATEYCILGGGGTFSAAVPAACECESTYTCACVDAHASDPCAGHGTFTGCIMDGTVPLVMCS
jgi:hypothetical protein